MSSLSPLHSHLFMPSPLPFPIFALTFSHLLLHVYTLTSSCLHSYIFLSSFLPIPVSPLTSSFSCLHSCLFKSSLSHFPVFDLNSLCPHPHFLLPSLSGVSRLHSNNPTSPHLCFLKFYILLAFLPWLLVAAARSDVSRQVVQTAHHHQNRQLHYLHPGVRRLQGDKRSDWLPTHLQRLLLQRARRLLPASAQGQVQHLRPRQGRSRRRQLRTQAERRFLVPGQ